MPLSRTWPGTPVAAMWWWCSATVDLAASTASCCSSLPANSLLHGCFISGVSVLVDTVVAQGEIGMAKVLKLQHAIRNTQGVWQRHPIHKIGAGLGVIIGQ